MSLKSALAYIQSLPEDTQTKFKSIDIDCFDTSLTLQNISNFVNTQYFMHNKKSMKRLLLECQRVLLMNDLKDINPQEWVNSMKENNSHKKIFMKDMKLFLKLKNEKKINYRYKFKSFIPLCDFIDFNQYRLF